MDNEDSSPAQISEFVQICLAILAWVLPDIHISLKVVSSLALLGFWALFRIRRLRPLRLPVITFTGLALVDTAICAAEYILAGIFQWYASGLEVPWERVLSLGFQLGFIYALIVALPIEALVYIRRPPTLGYVTNQACSVLIAAWIISTIFFKWFLDNPISYSQIRSTTDWIRYALQFVYVGPTAPFVNGLTRLFGPNAGIVYLIGLYVQFLQFEFIGKKLVPTNNNKQPEQGST